MIVSFESVNKLAKTPRVFLKDAKGNAFRVYPGQKYKLEPCGRFRLIGDWVHNHSDIRIAYALMFGSAHESVKGMKVTLVSLYDFQVVNGETKGTLSGEIRTI